MTDKRTTGPFLRRVSGNERGVTLIELLAAMTIGAIVLGVATSLLFSLMSGYRKSSGEYLLHADANRIANAISLGTAGAMSATVQQGQLILQEDGVSHKFVYDSPAHRLDLLRSQGSATTGYTLSDRVVSVAWSDGVTFADAGLAAIATTVYTGNANYALELKVTLQHDGRSRTIVYPIKLLHTTSPSIPP